MLCRLQQPSVWIISSFFSSDKELDGLTLNKSPEAGDSFFVFLLSTTKKKVPENISNLNEFKNNVYSDDNFVLLHIESICRQHNY